MVLIDLLKANWFDLLQSVGIIIGFVYTARAFSLDQRFRQAALVLDIASAHRRIWGKLSETTGLKRLLDREPDLISQPVTADEEHFVMLVLLHLASVHQAIELRLLRRWPGLERDIRRFFSRPIPQLVLRKYLALQPLSFREYLRQILR